MNKDKGLRIIAIAFTVMLASCGHLKNLGNSQKIGDLRIRQYAHYNFYYLEIYDKKRRLYFNYPVAANNHEFAGGYGPIYIVSKRKKKSDSFLYLVTRETKDSVCFLNYCFEKSGPLTDIEIDDKVILQKADSFCVANYSFYKRVIIDYKYWRQ